jgi:hypothetical protein
MGRIGLDMTKLCPSPFSTKFDLRIYERWLGTVPWQLFCTFTFAWRVSDAQALKVYDEFVRRLEIFLRGPIVYVRGDEKRYSGCGTPEAPRHFHAVITGHRRIDPELVSDLWELLAGRRENGAGANVRIYDPSLRGLAYVLKFISQPNGDWNLRNLDLFLPTAERGPLNRRQRRRLVRQKKRLELLQQVEVSGSEIVTGGLQHVSVSEKTEKDEPK